MLVRIRIKQGEFPYKLHFFSNFRAATRGHFYVFSEFLYMLFTASFMKRQTTKVSSSLSPVPPRGRSHNDDTTKIQWRENE